MENERHTWNLADIFPTDEAWQSAMESLESRIQQLIGDDPALEVYRYHLEDILRRAPHTLGGEAESVIASSGLSGCRAG